MELKGLTAIKMLEDLKTNIDDLRERSMNSCDMLMDDNTFGSFDALWAGLADYSGRILNITRILKKGE
ncbi:MAG TPA: hypothetical protein VMZ04_06295 [Anaerolineae bacterium]|nr:hypothetical protein [Anaerolineae bacterium]